LAGRGEDEVHTARAGAWKDCGSGAQLTFRPLVSVRTAKIASVRRGAYGRVHGRLQGWTCNIPPLTLHDYRWRFRGEEGLEAGEEVWRKRLTIGSLQLWRRENAITA